MLRQLALIMLPELILLCFLVTYFWVDLQSIATLLVFNTLFISIFSQLSGGLLQKIALLAVGNIAGTVWNYCFHLLIVDAADSFILSDSTLSMLYTVAYPLLNSLWAIAFWSLSLAMLRYSTVRGKPANDL
ncbi:MAG: hypothetical protein ACQCN4_04205 [Candidatus Bathyarchaeia archaeon]|jgi:hypothetical protein